MKIPAVILSVIILQTSASFFNDFRGAFISVETSFGKLLSDVAADVTEAIDCTIIAVEEVLSLDGFFNQGGSNNRRCRGTMQTTNNPPVQIVQDVYKPDPPPLVNPVDIIDSARVPRNDDEFAKTLEEHIESSIAIANQTLFDIVEHRDTNQKLEEIKSVLKDETERLSEVSALLRKELNKISSNVKSGLDKIGNDNPESSAAEILNDLKLLHEAELTNKSDAAEIHDVIDEITGMLGVKEIDITISHEHDDKLDDITLELVKTRDDISLIEDQLQRWREPEVEHLSNNSELIISNNKQNGSNDFPKTFKEVAKKIMNKSEIPDKTNKNNSTPTETPTIPVNVKPLESDSSIEALIPPLPEDALENYAFFDYESLFNVAPPSSEAHNENIEHAKKVIESSKLSDIIISSVLSQAENAASVFDSPDLFNFDQTKK